MQFIINKMIDTILLILIALLAIYPFCSADASYPFGKFSSEEFSLMVAVLVSVLVVFRVSKINIPVVAIGIAGFIITLGLQLVFLNLELPGNNVFTMMEMLIVGVFAIAVSSLINNTEEGFEEKVLTWLSFGLMIGALFNVFAAYLQYTGNAQAFLPYIFPSSSDASGSGIFGNLGQRNHFIDFLSTALFASIYLYMKGKLKLQFFLAFVAVIFFGDVFCAGRGIFVYFVLALAVVGVAFLIKRKHAPSEVVAFYKKTFMILLIMFVSLFIFQFIFGFIIDAMKSSHSTSPTIQTGVQRLGEIGQSTYRRFYEWAKAFVVFTQHPILGTGWYTYPHDGIYMMMDPRFMYIPFNQKLYTHCHNGIFNTLAEAGFLGTFSLIFYGIFYSFYRLLKSAKIEHLMVFVILCPMIVHSCLEFPLWYAYFLVLFILLLSFTPTKYTVKNSIIIKSLVCIFAVSVVGFALNVNAANDRLAYLSQSPQDYDTFNKNATELKAMVNSNGIWKLQALLILDGYIQPGNQTTNSVFTPQEQMQLSDALGNAMPYPGALYKQIVYHEISGDDAGAVLYANILAHAFPYYKDQMASQLAASPAFANPVAAIRAFKYEDKSIFARYPQYFKQ